MERPQYPLTEDAKETARLLVEAWQADQIGQVFELLSVMALNDGRSWVFDFAFGADDSFEAPAIGPLVELGHYGLVTLKDKSEKRTELRMRVTLLQELVNAVENNFRVSDYFLTLNAVGTIVHGNLTVERGGAFQSAAGYNVSNVNIGKLVGDLRDVLGAETLSENPDLAEAIESLGDEADEDGRRRKMGKVVRELGRCMEHLNNFGGAVAATMLVMKLFGG